MYIQTVYDGASAEFPIKSHRVISDNHMASLIAQLYFLKDSGEEITFGRHRSKDYINANISETYDGFEILRGGKYTTFIHVSEDDRYTAIDLLHDGKVVEY